MFDKITSRIQKLCYGLNMDFVDPVSKYSVSHGFFALCDFMSLISSPSLNYTSVLNVNLLPETFLNFDLSFKFSLLFGELRT